MPSKDTFYKFESQDNKVLCTEQVNYCKHEDADSRMFYRLSLVATPSNVVMRTYDTDSLVIAKGCKQIFDISPKLWLKIGTQSKMSSGILALMRHVRNFLHHHAMHCQLLMPLQSDYTALFKRKRKVAPFKL